MHLKNRKIHLDDTRLVGFCGFIMLTLLGTIDENSVFHRFGNQPGRR